MKTVLTLKKSDLLLIVHGRGNKRCPIQITENPLSHHLFKRVIFC